MIMLYKDKIDKPSFFYLTDEKNIEIEVEGHTLVVSNPNKIFWKEERYTKMDLINYYSEIANYILPYLNDRPESLNRHPNGIEGISFFQKDIKTSPPNWVKTIKIHSESAKKEINYLVCQNKATLIYMCNLGCIEINPWSSKIGRLNYPDFAIIEDVYYKPNAHYILDNAFSPDTLDKLKSVNFDIIIDDGSHTEQDQLACIREYLPKLKKNGVMIIEDIDPIEKLDRLANNNVPPGYQIEKIDLRHIINRIDDILLVIRYGETEKS